MTQNTEKKLIVGLGNPGKDYEYTRHNLGFLVVRHLADVLKTKFALSSFTNGLTAECRDGENTVILLMPLTYMNNSGTAVKQAVHTREISLENILILCDDFNLPYAQMRLRPKGSAGGQNGLKSIVECLQTSEFSRLRLGIGYPGHQEDPVDYVLGEFTRTEKKQLDEYVDEAANCCLAWLRDGIKDAMDKFNRRK